MNDALRPLLNTFALGPLFVQSGLQARSKIVGLPLIAFGAYIIWNSVKQGTAKHAQQQSVDSGQPYV